MKFTEYARTLADNSWEGSFEHPFITELVEGTLSEKIFRTYLLQDRYYLEHFAKLYQLIAQRTDHPLLRAQMKINGEHLQAGELLIRETFFRELNITEQEIKETAIAPTAYHYVSHMYRQLIDGSPRVAAAGMFPCAWLYHEIGHRLAGKGSPHPIYQRWIQTYATQDSIKAINQERMLLDDLYEEAEPEEQQQMMKAFLISSQMEYLFWGMAYQSEEWPY